MGNLKQAGRAIPIDKRALKGVAFRLEKDLNQAFRVAMRSRPNDPIRWREVWARDSHLIRTVKGHEVDVELLVTAGKDKKPGPYVSAGGFGHRSNRPVVIVQLNGSFTAADYESATRSRLLERHIYSILLHEMTHAADIALKVQYETGSAGGPYTIDDKDQGAYYNDPKEVRAFMQQVVDEILNFGGRSKNVTQVFKIFPGSRGLDILLKNSDTWKDIRDHLTPMNRKKIIKAVYRAIDDEGLFKTGATMSNDQKLRTQIIRLASSHPHFRDALLPLLETSRREKTARGDSLTFEEHLEVPKDSFGKKGAVQKGEVVLYKGRKYKVQYAGKTKFGMKAKLSFMDGSKEFWVPLNAVSPAGGSSRGQSRGGPMVYFRHNDGRVERMSESNAEVLEDLGHGYAT